MTAFGIDFGTTNSVLAAADGSYIETVALDSPPGDWAEHGFDKVLPTVLADRAGAIDFGWRAKRAPGNLAAVKRLFATDDTVLVGSQRLKIEEAAGVFFKQIKRRAALAGHTLDQAVVTIPANSRGKARFRTKLSAGLSGIEVVALVNEPTAAAMAYGRKIGDGERVLVFDWGGGTLDVTILVNNEDGVFMEEASKGIQRLGGVDIDQALHAALRARVPAGSELDLFDVELAKIRLSTEEKVTLPVRGGGTVEITRGDLEDAARPLVHRTREPVERCLSDLGQLEIDHLVMVGGSSKIPMVQRYVRELVGLEPMAEVDPMTAVAEGAALAAGILTGQVRDYDFFVGTEHALGTVVHDERNEPRFSTLIRRNTKLPASATDLYTPHLDNQEQVLVRVIEGDPDAPFDHEDNVILKEWEVRLLEPRPVAEAAFSITFEYDVDGVLHVTTVDGKTGTVMLKEPFSFGAGADKAELVEIRRRIDSLETADPGQPGPASVADPAAPVGTGLSEASRAAVRKAKEKVHPFVDDDTQAQLDSLIEQLVAASPDDEEAARTALERAVREHSYLL